MKWKNIKTTIFKELRGIVRDKKSIQKLVFYPLLIPLVIILFGFLFDSVNETKYVVGTNYKLTNEEISIIKDLDSISIKEYDTVEKLKKAYKNNKIEGYIIQNNNTYTIYTDISQNSGEIISSIANSYLESYNQVLGNKYLTENGIDSNKVFNNIIIESESLTKNDSNIMTNLIFSLVITYIIMIVVMVCIVVVTDATSGEKERGTLETILTFPIKSSELVMGKYLATTSLGFIIGLVSYLLSIPTFYIGKSMFKSYEEIVFVTNFKSIALVILVIFLTSLLSAGICMALAGKAKTYKEAQSSLQFMSILPMIPYFLKVMEINNGLFNLIPIANCGSALNDIVMNTINYKTLLIIIGTTIIYTVMILMYISKQYKKEETLFS
ncbi:MAG: ABC transporter permease [Bacilli bacterium]|nr:ABC transporter permease [Bacilli bacterium]